MSVVADWPGIPRGWAVCSLKDVADLIRGIAFPATAKSAKSAKGMVACLRTKNVQQQVDWTDLWWVPESYVKRPEQFLKAHDILMSIANSYDLVGKVALVKSGIVDSVSLTPVEKCSKPFISNSLFPFAIDGSIQCSYPSSHQ